MKVYINGIKDVSAAKTGNYAANDISHIGSYLRLYRYFARSINKVKVWKDANSICSTI
jgi:hypothetical protein